MPAPSAIAAMSVDGTCSMSMLSFRAIACLSQSMGTWWFASRVVPTKVPMKSRAPLATSLKVRPSGNTPSASDGVRLGAM